MDNLIIDNIVTVRESIPAERVAKIDELNDKAWAVHIQLPV